MKPGEIVERFAGARFFPTYISGDNCNLTQVIQNRLEEWLPCEPAVAEAAQMLTDLQSCEDCKRCKSEEG